MERRQYLTFIDVFTLATGAMISAGIFILPGIAFQQAGHLVFVSYFTAGLVAFLGILSIIELTSAMPMSGGDYFYVTRTLGPMMGTVSGVLSWLALSLKGAFAIFGLTSVIAVFVPVYPQILMAALTVFFIGLHLAGFRLGNRFEIFLVVVTLLVMVAYIVAGFAGLNVSTFAIGLTDQFAAVQADPVPLIATGALVFVSFGGIINISSITENIKDPNKTIPAAIIASILSLTIVYSLMVFVATAILPPDKIGNSLTPMADAGEAIAGPPGWIAMTIVSVLAFMTTSYSAVAAGSRYPLAMGRDHLLPSFTAHTTRRDVPVPALLLTGLIIAGMLLLDMKTLVKAASTAFMASFMFGNIAVLIIRLSKVRNYKPSFRAPLYPWLQILSIVGFGILIAYLGIEGFLITIGFTVVAVVIFLVYGRKQIKSEFALMHLVERVTNKAITNDHLEQELLDIIHSVRKVELDRFDHLIKEARILDIPGPLELDELLDLASVELSAILHTSEAPIDQQLVLNLLYERERQSSTAISQFVAIPHIIIPGEGVFKLLIIRVQEGARFSDEHGKVRAVFVLSGSADERNFHLRSLAAIAQTVQEQHFEREWLEAERPAHMRDLMLRSNRKRFPGGT